MNSTLIHWLLARLRYLSRICGFDTADSFPANHQYARTRWNAAYFDIASDVKPDEIERRLCAAIANTPMVFGYISNPTPRMQRALFDVMQERLRRQPGTGASDLVSLLIDAYDSEHIIEGLPGLRALIQDSADDASATRMHAILEFVTRRTSNVIEMRHHARLH